MWLVFELIMESTPDYIASLYLESNGSGDNWGESNREMESNIYFLKLFWLTNCLSCAFYT